MHRGKVIVLALLAALVPLAAHADYDGADPYEEYGQHIHAAENIAALTSSIFGDSVNLYNGSTSFSVVDFSIPGNNALPVELRRKLDIVDLRQTGHDGGSLHGFGDWDVDVPYISGTFTQQDGWTMYPSGASNRCTDTTDYPYTYISPLYGGAPIGQVWGGNHLHIPGAGEEELLVNNQSKSPAYDSTGTYKWVTSDNWKLKCSVNVQNNGSGVSGQGFVAVSPSGVSYTFDWPVIRQSSSIEFLYTSGGQNQNVSIPRSVVFLLATHVQDRFGNWVNYAYGGPNNDELTGIASSDGRSITLTWSGNTVVSATSALGTWQYAYASANWTNYKKGAPWLDTWSYLSSVTRPDSSQWTYTINSGDLVTQKNDWPADTPHHSTDCQPQMEPDANSGGLNYTIVTPSGASANFVFMYDRLYRDYVPYSCPGDRSPTSTDNYPSDLTGYFDNFQLQSKTISGTALPTQHWAYTYRSDPNQGPTYFMSTQRYAPGDAVQPFIPPGTCSTCNLSRTVVVTAPTSITKYTFGSQYARNEGQLLSTEVDDALSGNPVKTTGSVFVSDSDGPNELFANIAGWQVLDSYKDPMGYRNRPVLSTQVTQDGATFTNSTNSFDAFARSTSETEVGSASRTVNTRYYDDLTHWVIGQVASTAVNSPANACAANDTTLMSCTTYDSTTALPLSSYAFGKFVASKTWHPSDGTDQAGTLQTVTDGNTHTTTLGNWYRGVPRSILYADGDTASASVNDMGWVTAIVDQNGFTTNYGYDAMGRLQHIYYPSGDDVTWNSTYFTFQQVSATEYGIPAGHWKQTEYTGNDYTVTYFDAFWRPLVSESYDNANPGGTRSVSVKRYDVGNRAIYASYPLSSLGSYTDSHPGSYTQYDTLNRVTEVDADSELGTLQSKTAYLNGFVIQTTNPRGKVTTTSYLTYGQPSTDWPVSIVMPDSETTAISRDVYGKPLQLVRTGAGLSLTRSFVYDANQQLCKRLEPETNATVFSYDGAGNLQWSAGGLTGGDYPNTAACDTTAANSSGRRVDRTYDLRNHLKTVAYPDAFSNATFGYYPDGKINTATADNGGHPVTTTYNYDKRRLLTSESVAIPGTSPLSLVYGYDANGHATSVAYPDGRLVNYTPNALGQATQVGAYASAISYFPNGGLHQFTYGSGAVHTTTQNARQLPDRMTDAKGATAHDEGYDYDEDTNVAAITDYVNSSRDRDMTYDDLDRLTQTVSPMFGGDNKAVYTYDTLDNLGSARVGNLSNVNYQYDLGNHLARLTDPYTGASLVSYLYDAQGNVSNKNNQIFQFDLGDRLRGVTGAESYLYDAAGRRAQKSDSSGSSIIDSMYSQAGVLMYRAAPASMNVTDYIYLSGDLLAKVTNNNSNVIGDIDGVPSASNPNVGGWACSTGITQSINVELFVGGPPGSGTRIGTYTANLTSEPAIATACQVSSGNYRFLIPLSSDTQAQYAGQLIYVVGDSSVGNDNNQLSGSGQYTVPANPIPPDAPASINVPSSSTTGLVTVSWAASTNTTSYVLQQSTNGGTWAQIYSGTSTSDALNLGNGSYQYRVEACNANGCSAFTTSNTLTVAIIPAPPASINVPATSYTTSFAVSWSASANATNGYVLNQSLNGGTWTQIYSGTGTSRTVTVAASGNYKYEVKACGAGGCSGYTVSGTVVVTLPPASAPTLSSSATTSTSGTYTLSWTAVSGATSYKLNQKLNSGSWTTVYNAGGLSWTSAGVGSGTYAYVVYACNVGGCGPASSQKTVTVHRIPDPPATVTAPATVTRGVGFNTSWSASSEATSYSLKYTDVVSGAVTNVYTGPLTAQGVTIGKVSQVRFAAEACNANGCSAWKNAANETDVQAPGGQSMPAGGSSSE